MTDGSASVKAEVLDPDAHDEVPLTWPLSPETYWVAHPRSDAEPSTGGCAVRSRGGSATGWPVLVLVMGGLTLLRFLARGRS